MRILVINGGSSSFKLWYSDVNPPLPVEAPEPEWSAHLDSPQGGIAEALKTLKHPVEVVGHRIVHGGPYRDSAILTPAIRDAIARQVEFAPSHNRFELEAIDAVTAVLPPGTPQVVVFDTGFHQTLEAAAYVYPGPHSWLDMGIRRYGFHGINHGYVSRRAANMLGKPPESLRLITLHLGNGASLAAIRGGRSIDTTMGFTPLDGLMMGSRSGSVDPGILIFLLRHAHYSAADLDRILNRESGLLGLSGVSSDMREILHAMAEDHVGAQLAFDVFVHRICQETGAMLASLGGVDAFVFTGGVGENTPLVREQVCRQFEFLGLKLDAGRNRDRNGDMDIAQADSAVRVLVVGAREEWEIARECSRLLT